MKFSTSKLYERVGDKLLSLFAAGGMLFLYIPVVVLIVFSFNDNRSLTLPLRGFTLKWYEKFLSNSDMLDAIGNSLYVATVATAITIVIGTVAAFALDRVEFPGKTIFRRMILLPIALPGIITGISMLNMFKLMGINLSLETVILGHATGLVSIVVTQVFARLQRFNRRIEEASSDLGARPWQTFFYVTLPNIRAALIGSALLSFTVSFDEIPVTFFLTGRDNTLPMYIYSTLRRGITPEINAVGTVIVVLSLGLIVLSVYLLRQSEKE
ncbi:MAG: ABC transporter permease [Rhodospirillales bacterium]|jgi:spermidine/putrescine transport system permease protein|nr:ABC transporter permease [Rhodospirillales bacterium]MBT4040424.1 ABC transporter permease [Rhodospirillales bacterium]MBT4628134.1 ABC transporter permease [Rhodospirillales bacterium]MBT5352594.1 ABC transporter permease [Rhodospirillales bacterium]MBT5522085.1 ABC transporter permease [Rhodospirillales bacterium]